MEFQKIGTFFGETCSSGFYEHSCHPNTYSDLGNIVLANRGSVKTICMVSGSDSTHVDVTPPMNFEKKFGTSFSKNRAPGVLRLLVTSRAV